MRCAVAEGYAEPRDALAWDWGNFMATALPEVSWLAVPNLGTEVLSYASRWCLDGFIFTGGEDIGESPQRDRTEYELLKFALEHDLPVVGVCRGLQVFQTFFDGPLARLLDGIHCGCSHGITLSPAALSLGIPSGCGEVHSFHQWGIRAEDLAAPLTGFAFDDDGRVEAAMGRFVKVLGMMWHPERGRPFRSSDVEMLRRFFGVPKCD